MNVRNNSSRRTKPDIWRKHVQTLNITEQASKGERFPFNPHPLILNVIRGERRVRRLVTQWQAERDVKGPPSHRKESNGRWGQTFRQKCTENSRERERWKRQIDWVGRERIFEEKTELHLFLSNMTLQKERTMEPFIYSAPFSKCTQMEEYTDTAVLSRGQIDHRKPLHLPHSKCSKRPLTFSGFCLYLRFPFASKSLGLFSLSEGHRTSEGGIVKDFQSLEIEIEDFEENKRFYDSKICPKKEILKGRDFLFREIRHIWMSRYALKQKDDQEMELYENFWDIHTVWISMRKDQQKGIE